ncbi:MAG: radical SAM protein, partial [Nitrospiraceae bacterium]
LHEDPNAEAPEWLGEGLRKAMLNYMEGVGLTADVRCWFNHPVRRRLRRPGVPRDWVVRALAATMDGDDPTMERRFVWIGGTPVIESDARSPRKNSRVILPSRAEDVEMRLHPGQAAWLVDLIRAATPRKDLRGKGYPSLKEVRATYPLGGPRRFDLLLRSATWKQTRRIGLLLV